MTKAKGGFRHFKKVSGAHLGKIAVKAYVCDRCGVQHKGKPESCISCGCLGFTKFDSIGEANRWATLCLLEGAGKISHLERQVRFPLKAPNGFGGMTKVADYIADFVYIQNNKTIIEDFKSRNVMSDVAALKLRWMGAQGTPVKIVTS